MYLEHENHFGHTESYSYVTLVKRKLVSVRLEIVLISAQHRYTYVLNVPWAWKSFWAPPMVLLGVMSLWKLISVHLKVVLVSAQDRGMVCAKCTSGIEIIPGRTDGTPS